MGELQIESNLTIFLKEWPQTVSDLTYILSHRFAHFSDYKETFRVLISLPEQRFLGHIVGKSQHIESCLMNNILLGYVQNTKTNGLFLENPVCFYQWRRGTSITGVQCLTYHFVLWPDRWVTIRRHTNHFQWSWTSTLQLSSAHVCCDPEALQPCFTVTSHHT